MDKGYWVLSIGLYDLPSPPREFEAVAASSALATDTERPTSDLGSAALRKSFQDFSSIIGLQKGMPLAVSIE